MPGEKLKVLNVGGGRKDVGIPIYYADFEHLFLDIDPKVEPDVCMDARDLASLPAAEFDAIYCSHNLEHYYAHDVKKVLSGFHHVLTPTGFAEIRVPDIAAVMREVVEKNLDIDSVLYISGRGPILVRDVLYGYGKEIEQSGVDFYAHKTGFSMTSLARALKIAGFTLIARATRRGREIALFGFKSEPTPDQVTLLGINYP